MLRNVLRGWVILTILLFDYNCSFAQENNTLTFLGIPIDGAKSDMITALIQKGFEYDKKEDILVGIFNGQESRIQVQTNRNKVDRIAMRYGDFKDEAQIIIDYNNLFQQLKDNPKYILQEGRIIPQKEDISYEILVHNETYEASFIAVGTNLSGIVWFRIAEVYGEFGLYLFYENLKNRPHGEDL